MLVSESLLVSIVNEQTVHFLLGLSFGMMPFIVGAIFFSGIGILLSRLLNFFLVMSE